MSEITRQEDSILETHELTKYFGGFLTLNRLNLSIRKNEITSLIGPNGAGKTTFFNVLTGRFPVSSGRIFFKGRDITGLPSYKILKRGLARSFQITSIFNELTVLENIRSAVIAQSNTRMNFFRHIHSFPSLHKKSMHYLRLVGLEEKKDLLCSTLSHGDMRIVEVGITLASEPDVILLDEPSAGMTPEETSRMTALIKDLSERTNITFFIIEHDMNVVFSISDRIIVLHYGEILADGKPLEIKTDDRVKEAYLGGIVDAGG